MEKFAKFEKLTRSHGHLLVGVAKHSRVINYLSVAFNLTETFASEAPSHLRIPAELEIEASPSQYRWIGNRAMGALSVARLDFGEGTPLMPIDVADWQQARASEVMELLHESARGSFPIRGYPQPLIQAHEHAKLGGLEIEMLESLLLERIRKRDPAAAAVAQELRLLGQQLSRARSPAEQNEV